MIYLTGVAMTDKQAAVLAFIADFTARERWAPTRREIADHFGWRSANSADTHIMALIRKGRLERRASAWHVARNLVVVARTQQTAPIDEAKLAKLHEIGATAWAGVDPQALRAGECADPVPAKLVSAQCQRPGCAGIMRTSHALQNTHVGAPDFHGGEVVTMSPGGPGKPVPCLKCDSCGHSVTIFG